jgi:hypothetical protein
VFNPLSAPEVIQAVGGTLKGAAGGSVDDDYRRGQLLSAYSICRHLAAEEEARPAVRGWFDAAVAPVLAARGIEAPRGSGPAELGAFLGDLLAELRAAEDADSRRAAAELRRVLRGLCDREIEALAAAE